jgi:uncharacterized protein (DUF4415 family)
MEFEWNEEKAEANLAKHGIDFEDAIAIFEGATLEVRSDREGKSGGGRSGCWRASRSPSSTLRAEVTAGSSRHGGHGRMSEQRITRRTLADKRRGRTDWDRLRGMSEAEIEANAAADADNPTWTDAELAAAALVLPAEDAKVPVSIRLDAEVLDYFKAAGRGYQSRINAVLLGYVRSQQRRGTR